VNKRNSFNTSGTLFIGEHVSDIAISREDASSLFFNNASSAEIYLELNKAVIGK